MDSDVSNIVNCYFYGASGYATVLATACSGGTIMKTAGYGDARQRLLPPRRNSGSGSLGRSMLPVMRRYRSMC